MSSNNNKVCKVCRDAGKPESVFTSHFVKESKNGVVICPTLLNTVCRYCKQNGHTVKYCSSLKNKPQQKENEKIEKKVKLEINTNLNRFWALSEDDMEKHFPPPLVLTRQHAVIPKRWIDYDTDSDIEQEI